MLLAVRLGDLGFWEEAYWLRREHYQKKRGPDNRDPRVEVCRSAEPVRRAGDCILRSRLRKTPPSRIDQPEVPKVGRRNHVTPSRRLFEAGAVCGYFRWLVPPAKFPHASGVMVTELRGASSRIRRSSC